MNKYNKEELNTEEEGSYYEVEEDNLVESLLRNITKGYQEAWNKNNDKYEIKFTATITNHKITTPDGNKAVAYLRLERAIRDKGPNKVIQEEGKPDVIDEGWEVKLVHQEVYFFKSVKEQVDPRKLWKEQLFLNCLSRLTSAGLEYGELLQRLKNIKENSAQEAPKDETEERLNSIGLVKSTNLPTPLTEDEIKYRDHIAKERATEGII